MRRIAIIAALAMATPPVMAITKCVTPSGDIIYNDTGCPAGSSRVEGVDYGTTSSSGLRPAERAMLDRIRDKEAADRDARDRDRERDARHHISYGDRKRLRSLEMRKGSLMDSLRRGNKSWKETMAIREEIRGINRQIEQIRSPRW